MGAGRIPRLPGFANSRDLGGWPTAAGSPTRYGSVIRSNTPADLSPADLGALRTVGLTSVIDLRSAAEVTTAPHPLADTEGYLHRPLVDEATAAREPSQERTLGDIYVGSLTRNARTIAAVMVAIAAAPPGPAMICCTARRDRTGMVAALLLHLAGATREAIGCDYALTDAATGVAPIDLRGRQTGRSAAIQQMIDHVADDFGGPRNYGARLGLTGHEIDALVHRLTAA